MEFSSWIQFINQLPSGVGDIIWDFYYRDNLRKEIETNQKRLIGEFKYLIQSITSNINFSGLKKHKSFMTNALQKKKHSVKLPFPSRFHPEHSKYSSLTDNNAKFINSLDIFVGDLEEKLLVSTAAYKNRFLVKYEYPSRYQYVWKNNPKKNFIIKYLFYSIIQDFWCSHTCSAITKSGKRCSNWLKDGCLHRCNTHKFK